MRVGLIADWCLPQTGGIETQTFGLARELRKLGHESCLITTFPGPGNIDGVPVIRLPGLRIPSIELAASPLLYARMKACLIKGRFDIVHIHISIVAPVCLAALAAAESLDIPVVLTFHSLMRNLPRLLHYARQPLGLTRPNVLLTAVGQRLLQQIAGIVPDKKVHLIENGVDIGFWSQHGQDRSHGNTPAHIISALRLHKRKRPHRLITAFAKCCRSVEPSMRPKLTIAGDGNMRRLCAELIRRHGLEDFVTLAGWLSQHQLRAQYRRGDLFVMPSVHESFGIAALEARVAGLPVVAMRGAGVSAFVENGVNGLIADDDDGLAEAMLRVATNHTLLESLTAQSGNIARYDWPAVTARTAALYDACISAG